jgi:hypothetical protein
MIAFGNASKIDVSIVVVSTTVPSISFYMDLFPTVAVFFDYIFIL